MSNFNYGYEYQDLVAINIVLTLLTARKEFKMILDYKEKDKDKLDDIILEIENKKYKMQVKHNTIKRINRYSIRKFIKKRIFYTIYRTRFKRYV